MKWNLNKENSPKVPTSTNGLLNLNVDQVVKLILLGVGSVAVFGSLWYYNNDINNTLVHNNPVSPSTSVSLSETEKEVNNKIEDVLPDIDFAIDRADNEKAIDDYEMIDKVSFADFIENGVLQIGFENDNKIMEVKVSDITVAYTGYMDDVDAILTLTTDPEINLLGGGMLQTDKDIHFLPLERLAEMQELYSKAVDNKVSLQDTEWLEYGKKVVENMRNGYASYSLEFGYKPGDAPAFAFASLPFLNQDMSRTKTSSK